MPMPMTIAGRVEFVGELLSPTWVDAEGVEHKGEPLISKESALELLEMPSVDDGEFERRCARFEAMRERSQLYCGGWDANGAPV